MMINRNELKMDELETVNGGLWTDKPAVPVGFGQAVAKGAAEGAGTGTGSPLMGGTMVAVIGGAVGAGKAMYRFLFGD